MTDQVGARRALVIIDVQNAILGDLGGERGAVQRRALDAVVGRIAGMLACARASAVPVFHVQHDGPPGHRLATGTEGWRIRAELTPRAEETLVHKTACDAFFETALEARLRALGVGHLVIAGCMTQYCIDTTVRRTVSLGFDVGLAGDGHCTADSAALGFEAIVAHHNALLDGFDAGARTARVRPAAELP